MGDINVNMNVAEDVAVSLNEAADIAVNIPGELIYGKSLIDPGKGIFIVGTESWVAYGLNTIANDNQALKIIYSNNAAGAYILLQDATDLTTNLTIGTTYRIQARCKVNSGSVDLYVAGPNITIGTVTATNYHWYMNDFVANNATNNVFRMLNMSVGEILWIDKWLIQKKL